MRFLTYWLLIALGLTLFGLSAEWRDMGALGLTTFLLATLLTITGACGIVAKG